MPGWLQAVHLVGMVLWMGGLFFLTNHLGSHAEIENEDVREAFSEVERKSYYYVILPGFLITIFTGLSGIFMQGLEYYLSTDTGAWGSTFHVKLTLVALLIVIDQYTHFKMRELHDHPEEGSRPLFMGIHGIIGLMFILVIFIMKGRYFV